MDFYRLPELHTIKLPSQDCVQPDCRLDACSELGRLRAEQSVAVSLTPIVLNELTDKPASIVTDPLDDPFLQELKEQGIVVCPGSGQRLIQ